MRRAVCCLLLVILLGCERERRIPYIPPELKNWAPEYHGVAALHLDVFVTGWLHVPEAFVYRGGRLAATRTLPVLAVAIRHPREGVVLFGTGLNHAIAKRRGPYLGGVTHALLRPEAEEGQDLPAQLRDLGIEPTEVRWVVLPSLQFDHTGELRAFPRARVVVARAEHAHARDAPAGYIRREYGEVATWTFIDFPLAAPLATFPSHVDLFGDGSCLALDAAGFTPGGIALLVRLPSAPVLLAGDLAAVEETARYAARPISVFDMDEWWDRIWRVKRFRDLDPRLRILPGHDLGPVRRDPIPELAVHDFTPPHQRGR